jgi:Xaa-Pro dipeptidase
MSDPSRSAIYNARLEKLRALMASANLDVAVFVPTENMVYLTGFHFHLSERPLLLIVPRVGQPTFMLPALEVSQVMRHAPYTVSHFAYRDEDGYEGAMKAACEPLGLAGKRIGVEGLKMRYLEGQMLAKLAPNAAVESADSVLLALRAHKDSAELAEMRHAVAIAETALQQVIPLVRAGQTERQILALLQKALFDAGATEMAFSPIVLAGKNSGDPHGSVGDTVLNEGDLLLFDFGVKVNGYASDITRTFCAGQPSPIIQQMYAAVLAANEAGRAVARPGLEAQAVDAAARAAIVQADLGQYFTHRTGHGLGLDVHETPNMVAGNTQLLAPGMVFTVEPGVYLPDVGGVRIEDNVVITEHGAESLTSYPRYLQSIGG